MAKKTKVVGKKGSPRYITKDGTRFDTQKLPWGVYINRFGKIEYRVKGKLAKYSDWKKANTAYNKKLNSDRMKAIREQKEAAEADYASKLLDLTIVLEAKKAHEERKAREAEAKAAAKLAKQTEKAKRAKKKTWQEETDEWKRTKPPTNTDASVDPDWTEADRIFKENSESFRARFRNTQNTNRRQTQTENKKSTFTEDSPLNQTRKKLNDCLDVLVENETSILAALELTKKDPAFKKSATSIRAYIRRSNALYKSLTIYAKKISKFQTTDFTAAVKLEGERLVNRCIILSELHTNIIIEIEKIQEEVAAEKKKQEQLDQQIELEFEDLESKKNDALELLAKREAFDRKHFPEKFKKKDKYFAPKSGLAAALGMEFEGEKALLRRIFTPFMNARARRKEELRENLYNLEGISDQQLVDNPFLKGINPERKYSPFNNSRAEDVVEKNTERMKKESERRIRENFVNNYSTTNDYTKNNTSTSEDNRSSKSDVHNTSKNSSNVVNSSTVRSSPAGSGIENADFNRTDDNEGVEEIVEEQEKTNVVLKKILKFWEDAAKKGLFGAAKGARGIVDTIADSAPIIITDRRGGKNPPKKKPQPRGKDGRFKKSPNIPKGRFPVGMGGIASFVLPAVISLALSQLDEDQLTNINQYNPLSNFNKFSRTSNKNNNILNNFRAYSGLMGGYKPSFIKQLENDVKLNNIKNNSNSSNVNNSSNNSSVSMKAVGSESVQNIYNRDKGIEENMTNLQSFLLSKFAPELGKIIAGELNKGYASGSTGMPAVKIWG